MLTLPMLISAALPLAAAAAEAPRPTEVEQLFTAIREGRSAEVKRLLDANPSLATVRSSKGLSTVTAALFVRSGEGFVPVRKNATVSAVLAHRPPIDRFEAAALSGRVRVAQEIDADPGYLTAESSFGWTPLHFAAYAGNLEVAKLLLDRGAPIDRRANTKFRNTPLQVSLLTAQEEMAAFLIGRGADVRIQQDEGFTALHEAAQIGSQKVIALLLDAGADPNFRSQDGRTPLSVARKAGHESAAKLLQARGAREAKARHDSRRCQPSADRPPAAMLGLEHRALAASGTPLHLPFGHPKVVFRLQVHPELGRHLEDACQQNGPARRRRRLSTGGG